MDSASLTVITVVTRHTDGAPLEVSPGVYAPVIARWNISLALAYRFGAYTETIRLSRLANNAAGVAGRHLADLGYECGWQLFQVRHGQTRPEMLIVLKDDRCALFLRQLHRHDFGLEGAVTVRPLGT